MPQGVDVMVDKNYQKRVSSKPFFMLFALVTVMLVGLGFFRFNSAQLEFRLGRIERSIVRYTTEEAELRQILSGLTSPIRIYSFCREQLGMVAGTQEVVRVPRVRMASSPVDQLESQRGWRYSMFAFFGFTAN